jgi:hypothetical protein
MQRTVTPLRGGAFTILPADDWPAFGADELHTERFGSMRL